MITVWNRKLLISTYHLVWQSKIRDILSANDIDYMINTPVFASTTTQPEYRIYVRKKDHAHAWYLIKDVFQSSV